VGSFCWNELLTTDPGPAAKFYEKVFGYTSKSIPMGPATYTMLQRGDKDAAGVKGLDADVSSAPLWLPYVLVQSVDATTDKARGLGAKVKMEPKDWGPGRASVLVDTTGALFALWVMKAPM
jgi:predicted enzyme related to lactoylglutathione lyase